MPKFRILYLRNSVLEQAESVEAPDILSVIERASGRPSDVIVEIWSDKGRVGVIGPSPVSHA